MTDDLTDHHLTDHNRVRAFLGRFADASAGSDPAAIGRCFADVFLSADANGARPVARDAFLGALPKRAAMFAAAGLEPHAALDTVTPTALDRHYTLVSTTWTARRSGAGAPVRPASSFLVHDDGDDLRIVVYLNHEGPANTSGEAR